MRHDFFIKPFCVFQVISIHVPTWGTTRLDVSCGSIFNFNPRAYVRHDVRYVEEHTRQPFQSTCLREARRSMEQIGAIGKLFQSTCLREARHWVINTLRLICISIHVPTWGTTCRLCYLHKIEKFQSTCLREARQCVVILKRVVIISIHVPTWGTTWNTRGS